MHILVLGTTGQVGGMLVAEIPHYLENRYTRLTTAGRSDADLVIDFMSYKEVNKALNDLKPDIIINAIAYTAVDQAESEPAMAKLINARLPTTLASWCAKNNSTLIHYSTDFVFNGEVEGSYGESAETGPLSVYGRTKLEGEQAIRLSKASSIILRTSWVYGETGNNFMRTMQRLARERDTLRIVSDQQGTPTYSRHLAILTCGLIKAIQANPGFFHHQQRLYHASAKGQTTWHGFATAIFDAMTEYESVKVSEVNAIATSDYPTPAARPKNSVLNCDLIFEDLGLDMPDWHDGLTEAMCRAYADDAV